MRSKVVRFMLRSHDGADSTEVFTFARRHALLIYTKVYACTHARTVRLSVHRHRRVASPGH